MRNGAGLSWAVVFALSAVADAHPYEKYLPLQEGNRWSFEGATPVHLLPLTTAGVDARLWTNVYHLSGFPGFPDGLWVAFVGNDLYAWSPARGRWVRFLRFGAAAGTSYSLDLGMAGWNGVTVRVASKSASVADPYLNRTFADGVRFTFAGGAVGEYVFARNVGLVRWSARSAAALLRSARVGTAQWGLPILGPSSSGRFLLGVNYPWLHYGNDFGGNAWGSYGVHAGGDYATDFAEMKSKGVHVVRWFVFTDLRGGIRFDASGRPTGIDGWVIPDLQAALSLAETNGLHLLPVLFDFHAFKNKHISSGVQTGGRSAIFADRLGRQALLKTVVEPVLAAFAGHRRIVAWEIMNEPEWGIWDLPAASPGSDMSPIAMAQFWDFAARVSRSIHALARSRSTMGSASLKWHRVWTNAFAAARGLPPLNLDLYQTHYYPWMDGGGWNGHPDLGTVKWSPLAQSTASLGLDRPIFVGELQLPAGTASARLDLLLSRGYAGAMPWSFRADYAVDWPGYGLWNGNHAATIAIP